MKGHLLKETKTSGPRLGDGLGNMYFNTQVILCFSSDD